MLLTGFSRIITNTGPAGDPAELADGVIAVRDGLIVWTGPRPDVPSDYEEDEVIHFPNMTALPGFVDSHTHAVFAGDRREEFGMRLGGASYDEIMDAGGGIHSTVRATRAASRNQLYEQTRRRLDAMLATGTTTVEVKSGYGLDQATELLQLEVVDALQADLPMTIHPTFLAHAIPMDTDRAGHIDRLVTQIIPACAHLAQSCDVFCDAGVFDSAEAAAILEAGASHGLIPRIHAEQLAHSGGAQVAAMIGAASADHLDHVDSIDIAALREAGVVATLLPGVAFTMQQPHPPARALWDAGVTIAIATDCNPGTSYITSMPFIITLAVLDMGLSIEEALWAATRGGAMALRSDAGTIQSGVVADLVILDSDSPVDLAYRPDASLIAAVFAGGRRVDNTRPDERATRL